MSKHNFNLVNLLYGFKVNFELYYSETYLTKLTQKQFSDPSNAETVFPSQFLLSCQIWIIVTKINSISPYMGYVCHLGTTA